MVPLYRGRDKYGNLESLDELKSVLSDMYARSPSFLDTDLHGIKFDIGNLAHTLVEAQCNSIPKVFDYIFSANAKGEGKARWGDKTPYYVFHINTLLEMFPDAQFIHIIRDGRDCALSMEDRKKDFRIFNYYMSGKYWQSFVDSGNRAAKGLSSDVITEIQYEELLSEPEKVVANLCEFLGEEYSESVIDFKKSGEAGKTPLLQKPIQANNSNKWRDRMTQRNIRLFEAAAAETLDNNGYSVETSPEPLPKLLEVIYRIHDATMQKLPRKLTQT